MGIFKSALRFAVFPLTSPILIKNPMFLSTLYIIVINVFPSQNPLQSGHGVCANEAPPIVVDFQDTYPAGGPERLMMCGTNPVETGCSERIQGMYFPVGAFCSDLIQGMNLPVEAGCSDRNHGIYFVVPMNGSFHPRIRSAALLFTGQRPSRRFRPGRSDFPSARYRRRCSYRPRRTRCCPRREASSPTPE
jgi:hypothetical protein